MKRSVKKQRLLKKKIRNAEKKIRKANRILTKNTIRLDKYKNNNNVLSLQSSSPNPTQITQNWEKTNDLYFKSFAIRADGTKILGIALNTYDNLYNNTMYSTDSGKNFKKLNKPAQFVCISDDGKTLLLFDSAWVTSNVNTTNKLYTSFDGGANFIESVTPI